MSQRLVEIWTILKEDRKKLMLLGVLLIVLLGIGGKMLLSIGPTSSSAQGNDGGSGTSPTQVGQSALSRTVDLLTRLRNTQVTEVAQSPRLSRDLFAVDAVRFPPPVKLQPIPDPPPDIPPVIKPDPENADDIRAREIAQIRAEAEVLRLRSVVVGQSPLAVLELPGKGRTVVPLGGTVMGFKMEEVTTESVVLEKDAVRVRLWLPVPKP